MDFVSRIRNYFHEIAEVWHIERDIAKYRKEGKWQAAIEKISQLVHRTVLKVDKEASKKSPTTVYVQKPALNEKEKKKWGRVVVKLQESQRFTDDLKDLEKSSSYVKKEYEEDLFRKLHGLEERSKKLDLRREEKKALFALRKEIVLKEEEALKQEILEVSKERRSADLVLKKIDLLRSHLLPSERKEVKEIDRQMEESIFKAEIEKLKLMVSALPTGDSMQQVEERELEKVKRKIEELQNKATSDESKKSLSSLEKRIAPAEKDLLLQKSLAKIRVERDKKSEEELIIEINKFLSLNPNRYYVAELRDIFSSSHEIQLILDKYSLPLETREKRETSRAEVRSNLKLLKEKTEPITAEEVNYFLSLNPTAIQTMDLVAHLQRSENYSQNLFELLNSYLQKFRK